MAKEERLKREFPLHWAVFRKDYEELLELLDDATEGEINKVDVRGMCFVSTCSWTFLF